MSEPAGRNAKPLLDVRDLRVHFPVRRGVLQRTVDVVRAVDGASLTLERGESLGLVGESGCGKTTLGRAILRLVPVTSGTVEFQGQPILGLRGGAMRRLRQHMQIIFQDPAGSLNPRMRIGSIVAEPLQVHRIARGAMRRARVEQLLESCGLPAEISRRYPHELSGGQRQRVCIARALALNPTLLVCDEPTSALDVSIQAQILNLLRDLQEQLNLSYLFISHDMAVVHHLCHRIAVMLRGKIVEMGNADDVIQRPQHDYTQKLLAAVPEAPALA